MNDPDKSQQEILLSISRSRAFSHLEKEKLGHIASLANFRRFSKGDTILTEGDENHDLYFLLKGSVSVYSGGKFVCRYGRAGDIFGEMSVVAEAPVSATVVTNEDVETIIIDGGIVGGFKSANDHELVTVFYKLFSLSLLEKLRLTTLKARLFEDATRHALLQPFDDGNEFIDKTVEKTLNDTLLTSLAVHTADQAIVVTDPQGRVSRFNLAAESLFSRIELQVAGRPIKDLCEEQSYNAIYPKLLDGELSSWSGELTFIKAEGRKFPARTNISIIRDQNGLQIGLLSIITDISKEKQLEEQLRQSQKMEAVGQLAGGMAHDFNNILQIVISYTQLALRRMGDSDGITQDLKLVMEAAKRGSSLINRLLAFSRRRLLIKKVINLNDLMHNLVDMMRRVIGEHIAIKILPGNGLWNVHADSSLVEQVLINLSINARDAMPTGGVLTLETRNIEFSVEFCQANYWARPGKYVEFSVADSGMGIGNEDKDRIFEPFYTTKDPSEGTGLGLSMVIGIVEQHEGFLHMESEIDAGTKFHLYFPMVEQESSTPVDEIVGRPPGGTETILVAEDEQDVRNMLLRILTSEGYNVFAASDGVEAEKLFTEHEDAIDLVMLDAIMPRRNGKEVYEILKAKYPNLPFIFISGHTPVTIGADFIASEEIRLIRKPFSTDQLLWEVRNVLDSPPPNPAKSI